MGRRIVNVLVENKEEEEGREEIGNRVGV